MIRRLLCPLLVAVGMVLASVSIAPTAHAAPWVKNAQTRLNALGCDSGPADGRIGDHTRSAVLRFQSRHGLPQSGTFTDKTRRTLASTKRRCDVRPVPARSGTGRRLVLSQGQNWLWLVRANGTVAAQGGFIDNPSALRGMTGQVGSYCGRTAKIKRNYSSGGLVLANFVRWQACGVGFHRIPQYTSGQQIHPDWMLGTNMRESHGCIRLSAGLSQKVWDFAGIGTRVRVV